MSFSDRYKNLNTQQKKAVDTIDGPVMVIAGPGTGKTELLSMRTANILRQTDTLPENILCLTFTESGATAMRTRLASIIGMDAYKVAIHTFHSFGAEIINQNNAYFFSGASFQPADELSCYEILHGIFDEQDYTNPIASKMNGEYTHLSDTIQVISELKRSGLTSSELLAILGANDIVYDGVEQDFKTIFADRIGKTTAHKLAGIVTKIQGLETALTLPGYISVARILADSLIETLESSEVEGSTKPLTAWRNEWFKKNEMGVFVFKARERQAKLRAVSYIYGRYIERMQEEQLFDFDDMIMQIVHGMEVNDELRFNLQERYQYIMVDEFQDTNMAQMRILYNLADNPVNEGRPNVLVVGDDDQAIYSFQGANVGNISAFLRSYRETAQITLTDNYRSTETILSHARSVISLGNDRLENHLEGLDKTLTPHVTHPGSIVNLVEYPSSSDEHHQLVQSVEELVKKGTPAQSIAIIARRHYELQALLPYFAKYKIPVNYERRDNVLENEIVQLVEHIAHIVVALFEKRHNEADALLPELVAHPAFGFSPQDIWRLSLTAHDNHQKWMEVMASTLLFIPLQNWLITLSQLVPNQPLEHMLDLIIGVPSERHESDSPFDDDGKEQPTEEVATDSFASPLFEYFFSTQKLAKTPNTYLTYLEALRTIRAKLRDYQPNEPPTLQSFLEFIRLHRELGSSITSLRADSAHQDYAVNLLTAHKSKGLEFDHVFIVNAVDTMWGEHVRSRSRLINYPENLRLAPVGDSLNERLRLFFVAMTRAKIQLNISYSLLDDSGKTTLPASFLTGESWQTLHATSNSDQQIEAIELAWYQPLVNPIENDMRHLLAPRLENYKMSITHVNNFLDITHGGPQGFLLNNLLGFPHAMSASAGFGSAVHSSLQKAHMHLSATGDQRPIEDVLHDFEEELDRAHLSEADFTAYLQKGSEALTAFLTAKQSTFLPQQKAELSFAGQGVQIGEMRLTGLLDLVDFTDNNLIVTDYKTGKPPKTWNGSTDYEKIKLHKYRQQLMFYHLLVRHSRDYSRFTVEKGILQFVEPTKHGEIIELEATFTDEDLERFVMLLGRVWQHITELDFPDISHYETTYKGMLAFEEDLLQ